MKKLVIILISIISVVSLTACKKALKVNIII